MCVVFEIFEFELCIPIVFLQIHLNLGTLVSQISFQRLFCITHNDNIFQSKASASELQSGKIDNTDAGINEMLAVWWEASVHMGLMVLHFSCIVVESHHASIHSY